MTPGFARRWLGALLMALPLLAGAEPVQELLDRLVAREKLPGAVLLVSGPAGRVVATAGLANLKTREPVTPQTRFYIASSGKLVTAVATLQLVQEGKLKLNDPVLPWLKNVAGITGLRNIENVNVEQLLSHRSGLAEYFDNDFEDLWASQPAKVWTADEALAQAFGKRAPSRPGRAFNYNNTNFVLLGRLLELVDGAPYASAVQRRVLGPVGMAATSVGAPPGAATSTGVAHGYARSGKRRAEDVSYTGWNAITGDGAIMTTAADYGAFLLALLRDGKLLPPAMVKQMCTVQKQDPDSEYGLGCSVEESDWGEAWGHSGTVTGFNAETWHIPKIGVTVVFMTNGDFKSDEPDLVKRAVKAYLRR